MTLHKYAKPEFFILFFFLEKLYSKDVGPWKLKWAPKFQNLGANLAPNIFNKVSPLTMIAIFLLHEHACLYRPFGPTIGRETPVQAEFRRSWPADRCN